MCCGYNDISHLGPLECYFDPLGLSCVLVLPGKKEGVSAGWVPWCPQVREGSTWSMGRTVVKNASWVRCFVAGPPLHSVYGLQRASQAWPGGRTSLLVNFCHWGLWCIPLTSFCLIWYCLIQVTEVMSLPGLPPVVMSCGLGNARTGSPSIGWSVLRSLSLWGPLPLPKSLYLLLPPLRLFLHLLLLLFPAFIVMIREQSKEKGVYTILSRPDVLRSVHRRFET